MAEDNLPLVMTFSADIRAIEAQMNRMNKLIEKATGDGERRGRAFGKNLFGGGVDTRGVETGLRRINAASGSSRAELLELSHVARAVFDSLAAGQNPLRILAQEGARVGQAIGDNPNGLGGALTGLVSLINPVVAGIVGVAVVMAALVGAEQAFESEHRKTLIALLSTASASGLTIKSMGDIAEATARLNHESISLNRSLVQVFAGAGVEGSDNIRNATQLVEDFAVSTGQKVPAAAKELAKALQNPVSGVTELNEVVRGFVSGEQIRLIDQFAETGHQAEAQKIILDALKGAIEGNANEMSALDKALRDIAGGFNNATMAVGGFFAKLAGYKDVGALPALKAQADVLQKLANDPRLSANARFDAQNQLGDVNKQIAPLQSEQDQIDARSKRAQDNVASQHKEQLINNGDPSRVRIERLTQDVKDIQDLISKEKDPAELKRLQEALVGTKTQLLRAERRETHAPGSKASPEDHTEDLDDTAKSKLDEATKEAADAMAKLATSIEERARLEILGIQDETAKKTAALDRQIADIEKTKLDTNKKEQIELIRKAKAETENAGKAEIELVQRSKEIALIEQTAAAAAQDAKIRANSLQKQEDYLTALAGLTLSTQERNKLEQQALAIAQQRARDQSQQDVSAALSDLAVAKKSGGQAGITTAQKNLGEALDNQQALPAQQSLQTQALANQQLSPWDAWVREGQKAGADVGQALESTATHALDQFNSGLSEAIVNGKNMGQTFSNIFKQMEMSLIQYLLKQAEIGIFTGGAGGQGGGAGAGSGGVFGALFNSIFHLADGGMISGQGGPRDDKVLARLSPGEFVVNARATSKNAGLLHAINKGLPGFADGGIVSASAALGGLVDTAAGPSGMHSSGGGTTVHQHFTLNAPNSMGFDEFRAQIGDTIKHMGTAAAAIGAQGGHQMTIAALNKQQRYGLR